MRMIKNFLKGILICLLLVILIFNISIIIQSKKEPNAVPTLFGYKPFIVLSGSMEPNIHVGDLVLVKEVDENTLKKDDIIAYREIDKNTVTTHRIVDIIINEDGKTLITTKGDANNAEDEPIDVSQIEGVFQKRIGKMGYAIMFIQEPLGFAVVVLVIFIGCMLIYHFQNRNINKEIKFKNEEERKAFEEFKKSRENNN